jgi:hypothetical protein
MLIERIKILAVDLGLNDDVDELIRIHKYIAGEYAFTAKGKARDKKKYQPQVEAQKEKIRKRLSIVFPEFVEYSWAFGRLSDGSCYITILNPDF